MGVGFLLEETVLCLRGGVGGGAFWLSYPQQLFLHVGTNASRRPVMTVCL